MQNQTYNESLPLVLIVDDDQTILDYAEAVLEWMNFSVITASTGNEMLGILDETTPDLILLDIVLPDISGIELAKIINSNALYKDIPILALTSDTSTNTVDKAYKLNIFDFIEKPINLPLMVNRIIKAIRHHNLDNRLRDNEIKLKQLQNIAGMGYWEYDSETDRFDCSDALYELLGSSKNIPFNLYSFLSKTHEDDLDNVSKELHDAIDNAKSYAIEHRLYDNDGNEIIVLNQGMVKRKKDEKEF